MMTTLKETVVAGRPIPAPATVYTIGIRESGIKPVATVYDAQGATANTPEDAVREFVKRSQRTMDRLIDELAEAKRNMEAAKKLTVGDFVVEYRKF